MNKCIFLLAASAAVITFPSAAYALDINFDDMAAPADFFQTVALTTQYSGLGVTFSGPTSLSGGAILNVNGNFGFNPLSGSNFLAFNRFAQLSDGGTPTDPETISFSNATTLVSIYANTSVSSSFTMSAYDSGNNLLASDTVNGVQGNWTQVGVSTSTNISYVILTESGNSNFCYDNLHTNAVPEPMSIVGLGMGALALIRRKRSV